MRNILRLLPRVRSSRRPARRPQRPTPMTGEHRARSGEESLALGRFSSLTHP
jgi:hypothetical protein